VKRTPILRKTPLRQKGCLLRLAGAAVKGPRQRVTVEFDDDGAVVATWAAPKLRQSRSTGKPTKAQVARWDSMRARGCVACHLNGVDHGLARASFGQGLEIHHLLSGGRRRGHDFTVCLCHYHHQGKFLPYPDHGYQEHAEHFGPSLERQSRRFHEFYGADDLLLEYQNLMLARQDLPTFPQAVAE